MEQKQESNEATMNASDIWEAFLERAREEIAPMYFSSMISPLHLISIKNGICTIGVPNSFTKDIIQTRYINAISNCIAQAAGQNLRISLSVSPPAEVVETIAARSAQEERSHGYDSGARANFQPEKSEAPQNKYTFDNFIVGDSNKFAYNAALMVAEVPGQNYNPLFIYGGTGLGKTHLLLAIKDYAEKLNPTIKVRYVQTSQFIDDFVATLTLKRDKSTFDQKYINNKIVMFDDIQALSGTDATQNKFFDVFNLLYHSNSHIVLSSDRPPRELSQLSNRIQSRFEGGLIIDVRPPDLETRIAILRIKARAENVDVPDDAMIFIASKVKENIRALEGLLNRVFAHHRLYGIRIDLQMVQDVLKDQVAEADLLRTPTVDLIQNRVSNFYNIPRSDLIGKNRSRSLVHGRQVAMYLCRELTNETLISIGGQFGNRDHATVIHSCRKVECLIKQRKDILREVSELTNMINKST